MNVLFVTADQWRGDCLSALGHPCLKTPNLDSLAREGVLFKLATLWHPWAYLRQGDVVTSFGTYLGYMRNEISGD